MDNGLPHELEYSREYGRSPGNGMTPMPMSRDPLATEGEATPGPDDVNPYDERERELAEDVPRATLDESPTKGEDPFVFDDLGAELPELTLPDLEGGGPSLPFMGGRDE